MWENFFGLSHQSGSAMAGRQQGLTSYANNQTVMSIAQTERGLASPQYFESPPSDWVIGAFGFERAGNDFEATYGCDGRLSRVRHGQDNWKRPQGTNVVEYVYTRADGTSSSIELERVKNFSLDTYFSEASSVRGLPPRLVSKAELLCRISDDEFTARLAAGFTIKITYESGTSVSYGGPIWIGSKHRLP